MRKEYAILCVVALLCSTTSVSLGRQIDWLSTLEEAKQTAIQTNRLILIHFWREGCPPCAKMEQYVFPQAEVAAAVHRDFVPVKINASRNPQLASQFGVNALPADVIISPQGQVVSQSVGGISATKYTSELSQVAASWQNAVRRQYAQSQVAVSPTGQAPPADPRLATRSGPSAPYQGGYRTNRLSGGSAMSQPPYNAPINSRYGQARPEGPPSSGTNTAPPLYVRGNARTPLYTPGATVNPNVGALGGQAATSPRREMAAASQAIPRNQAPTQNSRYPLDRGMAPSRQSNTPLVASREPAVPSATPDVRSVNPPIALDGYCPVQLAQQHRWVQGDPRWGVSHEGRTYLFAGAREAQDFWDNPDHFAAVLSGEDLVSLVDQGRAISGSRNFGGRYEDRLYLFSCAESFDRFNAKPHHYVAIAKQIRDDQIRRDQLSRHNSNGNAVRQY